MSKKDDKTTELQDEATTGTASIDDVLQGKIPWGKVLSMKKPFTWEAYREAARDNPHLNLIAAFSFDHIPSQEIETMAKYFETAGLQFACSAEYMTRVVDHLRTSIPKH